MGSVKQVQVQQLDFASRLLLGALLEAHELLQSLQAEVVRDNKNIPVDNPVENNIEKVKKLTMNILEPTIDVTKADQTTAKPSGIEDIVQDDKIQMKARDKKEADYVTTMQSMPDLVQNIDISVSTKQNISTPLPDLLLTGSNVDLIPSNNFSPKKYSTSKKKMFKLTTLE